MCINDAQPLFLAMADRQGNPGSPWRIWAPGFGTHGDRNAIDIASRYDYDIYGTAIGLDFSTSKELLIEINGSYSKVDLDFDDLTDSGDIESYHGALYGSGTQGPWYLDGLLSYGRNRNETPRHLVFGGINRSARADYGRDEFSFYTEGGRRVKLNGFDVQPLASLQAIYLRRSVIRKREQTA